MSTQFCCHDIVSAERHLRPVLQVVKARVLDAKQTALEKKVNSYAIDCLYEAYGRMPLHNAETCEGVQHVVSALLA